MEEDDGQGYEHKASQKKGVKAPHEREKERKRDEWTSKTKCLEIIKKETAEGESKK